MSRLLQILSAWLQKADAKLPDLRRKPTLLVLVFIACFSCFTGDLWKPYNQDEKGHNFYWDVFGYYSYLPAYFCNGGSMEIPGELANYNPPGPLGTHVPKYTYGLSVMYAPFFAMAYKIAYNTHGALDGFSNAFVTLVHWSTLFYVLCGLLFLRSFLLRYFNEVVVAITLTAVFFGSMIFHYTLTQAEMTHGYLFSLFCAFLWLTQRWHERPRWSLTFWLGFVIGLIALIRPTEVFIFALFVFWDVRSVADLKKKFFFLLQYTPHLLMIALIAAAWWIPQLLFYKKHAGTYFYFSYMRERFFWSDPQIINVLFSYRKGWITYTPLVALSFIGFFFVKKDFVLHKLTLILLTSAILYILSCWWDWNYGGCFGARSFSQQIAILAIPLAFLINYVVYEIKRPVIAGITSLLVAVYICSSVFLNLGFSYQYNTTKKIHPWAMSKNNYWRIIRTYQFSDQENDMWWRDLREPDFLKYSDGSNRND